MLRQQVVVDARLVIEAFEKTRGDQANQIAIAFRVFAQQHQMIRAAMARLGARAAPAVLAAAIGAAIVAAAPRDVHLAADDRLYANALGFVVELLRGEQIAMIGNRHRRHALSHRLSYQRGDFAGAVEKTVIGVNVKMSEARFFHVASL